MYNISAKPRRKYETAVSMQVCQTGQKKFQSLVQGSIVISKLNVCNAVMIHTQCPVNDVAINTLVCDKGHTTIKVTLRRYSTELNPDLYTCMNRMCLSALRNQFYCYWLVIVSQFIDTSAESIGQCNQQTINFCAERC